MFRRACCVLVVLLFVAPVCFAQFQPPLPPAFAPTTPYYVVPSQPETRPSRHLFTQSGPPKLDIEGDPLPAGAIARYGVLRLRHGRSMIGISFTHDGKYLCTVSDSDRSVKLWDTATGKEVAKLQTTARHVALAKDGSVVLAENRRIRVWQPIAKSVRDLPEKTLPEDAIPTAIAVNPDSKSIALATNGKVLLIDVQTGKTLKELMLPGGPRRNGVAPLVPPIGNFQMPYRLVYSPDGHWLGGCGGNTGVWLWAVQSGKRMRKYFTNTEVPDFFFSPDGTKLAITGQPMRLFEVDSEEEADGFQPPPQDNYCFNPRFSDDGKLLYSTLHDGTVIVQDAATGEAKDSFKAPEANLRGMYALSPDTSMVAAIDENGNIRLWNRKTGKGLDVKRLPQLMLPRISDDSKTVTALDRENKIHTFDLATGKPGKVIDLKVSTSFFSIWDDASRRAAAIIWNGSANEIHFIDIDTQKTVAKYSPPQNSGSLNLSFGSSDRVAVTIPGMGVTVLNPANGKVIKSIDLGPMSNVMNGKISPDGRLVALGTSPVTIWEVTTGKKRFTLEDTEQTNSFVFNRDGRMLAVWDHACNVTVFDVRTGAVVRRLKAAESGNSLTAATFSADGKRLVGGFVNGGVTIWDVATGEVVIAFSGHEDWVTGLTFSADGKRLVSTSQDGTALVWDVPDKPLLVARTEVKGFEEAIQLLGSTDAMQAQSGFDYIYHHPTDAVKQVGVLVPVPTATPAAKMKQFISDLENDDYFVREAAVKELVKLGCEASPLLKDIVRTSESAEARKLANEAIAKIEALPTRPDDLKLVRVVEALENIGTPEARAQLEKWAAGPAGLRLTVESTAAIARMKTGKR